jgi:hypothetical protein
MKTGLEHMELFNLCGEADYLLSLHYHNLTSRVLTKSPTRVRSSERRKVRVATTRLQFNRQTQQTDVSAAKYPKQRSR